MVSAPEEPDKTKEPGKTKERVLTRADIERLVSDPSPQSRVEMVSKVSRHFVAGDLTDKERTLAEDIFRLVLKDVEVRVRRALSDQLRASPDVPRDVVLSLVAQVDEVALPFIQSSSVLTDDDLIAIVRTNNEARHMAIAGRETVSDKVSRVLIDVSSPRVVETLVKNDGADLSPASLDAIVSRHGENTDIQQALIDRHTLPIGTAERLVTLVSDALRRRLEETHNLSREVTDRWVRQGREVATLDLMTPLSKEEDVQHLVESLMAHDRLTATIMLRSLCSGSIHFFEHAISALARVPLVNARILIHDKGRLGLKALYEKAGLPASMLTAFETAVDIFNEIELDGEKYDAERFSRCLLERLVTSYDEEGGVGEGDMNFLLDRLDRIAHSSGGGASVGG